MASLVDLVRRVNGAARRDGIERRDADIVGQTQTGERPRQLEAARQSEAGALMRGEPVKRPAVKAHRTLLVAQRTADAIDQRRFTGAIGPDQPQALTRRHGQRNIFQCDEAAETLAEIVDHEEIGDGAGHGTAPGASVSTRRRPTNSTGLRWKYFWNSPTMPFGAAMTKKTKRKPTINRLTADEIVTVAICCSEPRRSAPIS